MSMPKKRTVIIEAFVLMIVLQAVRGVLEMLIKQKVPYTLFGTKMINMCLMVVLTSIMCCYVTARQKKIHFRPSKINKFYIIFSIAALALYVATPSIYIDGYTVVLELLYSSIVTPLYEEIIFRGYLWSRFEESGYSKKSVYMWSILLFTVWHIGYMVPNIIDGNWVSVLWKLAAGAGYGAVLGFMRTKTDNCYATFLLHGVLNLFMV